MANFYEIFEKLCSELEISASRVSKETGIAQSTIASWKSRNLSPNTRTLKKLAEYFDVSTEYLITGDESKRSRAYGFFKENALPGDSAAEEEAAANERMEQLKRKISAPVERQNRMIENMVSLGEESEAFLKLYNEYLSPKGRRKVHRYTEDLITNPDNLLPGISPLKAKDPEDPDQ